MIVLFSTGEEHKLFNIWKLGYLWAPENQNNEIRIEISPLLKK
ncbi:hypothetical protein NARC_90148 [Candidatus Nitrosocosmicus arcticus]|uniref:Uncharacterized protein n=1 Tax=Candidatus Nitrosocosmicus arcticus TaxID=2035267 RepID=A0A557SUF9_9ARCH|nr:hypothetical protein NARC_90148 [Candidatus Nitrosocosmicus arcticus]